MEENTDLISLIREKDTFAGHLGMEVIEAAEGHAHVAMPLGEATANAIGIVHGGAIFGLADYAFALAANSEGVLSVAIESSIQYMSSCQSEGRLEATAEKVSETRRLGFYRMKVFKPDGEVIAVCQAIVYKKV